MKFVLLTNGRRRKTVITVTTSKCQLIYMINYYLLSVLTVTYFNNPINFNTLGT